MCGIVGYVGYGIAQDFVFDALKRLEYRGYDSVGVAYLDDDGLHRMRALGGVSNLEQQAQKTVNCASTMIGHTRWATHGRVSIANAHPQMDAEHKIAVVHNGIIENFEELRRKLLEQNVVFESTTDTEVIPNLISAGIKNVKNTPNNILWCICDVLKALKGSFALCILVQGCNKIFATARFSPLILAKLSDGYVVASDIMGLGKADEVYTIPNDTLLMIDKNSFVCYDMQLNEVMLKKLSKTSVQYDDDMHPYSSFMEKEINEGTKAINDTVRELLVKRQLEIDDKIVRQVGRVVICACGTALHAGRIFGCLLEELCGITAIIDYASEYRYRNAPIDKQTICIFISQSGETADTLSCVEFARSKGAYCIGVSNVPTSRLVSLVDYVVPTYAGVERAVASTKAYMAQLGALYLLGNKFCEVLGRQTLYDWKDIVHTTDLIKTQQTDDFLSQIVPQLTDLEHLYILGRGIDYVSAMEGALKIKEISYIHCEAMPLGELKHGSLALFGNNTYAIVLMTQNNVADKVVSNIHEIRSRGAKVILLTTLDVKVEVEHCLHLDCSIDVLSPFVVTPVLQQLALRLATARKLDVDKPRNLAKSVTVE